MLYKIVKLLMKVYYAVMFKVVIVGKENVPKQGCAVLCCNHMSNYDPITMAVHLDRLPRYIAKKELFENKFMNWLLTGLKAFPVDREAAMDMKAFKTAIKTLKEGEMLGIFAEGTRVKEGEAKAAKAGVAMFALKGHAPIIPVAISGTYKFRSKITISYGMPMTLEEYEDKRVTADVLTEITEKVMAKVNEMKVKA